MISIAIIGAGHWGPNLIRNFHNHRGSRVRWVVDADPRRLEKIREIYPEVLTGVEPRPALEDAAVDAVVIATPTSTHYEQSRDALAQGKHVLVEKPIATRAKEAEELIAAATRSRRVLMVGHVFLYNQAVVRIRRYLQDASFGRVYYVAMVRTNLGPIRADVNAAWDLASHDISIANYWIGARPTSVSAVGGTWINPGVEDSVFATLTYPGDVLLNLHASWLNPRKVRDATVVTENKMLTFDDMDLQEPIRIYDKAVTADRHERIVDTFATFRTSLRDGDITIPKVSVGEPLKAECEHFLECIASGAEPVTGGAMALDVVRCLEAMERSIRSGGSREIISP